MKRFLKRRVDHAKKHWWTYGLGAVAVSAALAWATTSACEYAAKEAKSFRVHYLQSETNAAEIVRLKEYVHRLHDTNILQQAQINALTETNMNLRYWIRKLQK